MIITNIRNIYRYILSSKKANAVTVIDLAHYALLNTYFAEYIILYCKFIHNIIDRGFILSDIMFLNKYDKHTLIIKTFITYTLYSSFIYEIRPIREYNIIINLIKHISLT